MLKRRLLIALAAAMPLAAAAQTPWPAHSVRLVVPAPAGSSLDVVARLLADKLKERWAQPVIVENKPGAGGMLGVDVAAKAAPDGNARRCGPWYWR